MKWTVLLTWLASWAFASRPARAADQFFAHSYAVVIGIDHYPSRMWPQLEYGVKDARAIAAFLRTQDYDQIITLYDQQASKQAIVAAMQNQLAPKLKAKDRVLIFFAGHGYTETLGGKDRGYIVPYDGDTQSAGYISMDELETLSDYMGNARHQLFIMDSCYGGLLAVTRSGLVNPNIPDYLNNISDRVARQVITAGGKNQQVLDGGPKGHSFFVDYLLEALAEGKADTNGDGYITFDELSAYMIPRASSRQQTPMFGSLSGHQAGEYLFRSPLGRLAPVVSANEPRSGPVRGAASETIAPPVATDTTNAATHPATSSISKKISVAVVNNQGRFIPGIQQSNFRVLEDGVPQTIVDFRDTAPAVAILLECTTLLQQHMGEITGTAARLIDSLSPTDYVAVAEFDMRLKILTDFSSDHAIAHTALNQSQTCGFVESNLFDALKDLTDRMKPIREKRKAIVVFTTGVDTFSRLSPDQARIAIRAAGVPIYAVRLHGVSRMETAQTDENLKALVADAGGQAFFPNSPDQYASALNSISDDLRGYEISFQRASQEEHPGTSNIRVELVNAKTGGPLRMTDPKGAEVPYQIIVTPMP